MRKAITIVAILFLAACESDFDKCMKAEVPRAEESLGLAEANSKFERATEYSKTISLLMPIQEVEQNWLSQNPAPEGPEYPDYECSGRDLSRKKLLECIDMHELKVAEYEEAEEAYEASAEYQSWLAERNDFMASEMAPKYNAVGIAGNTRDEVAESANKWRASQSDLRLERALAFDCWGAEKCDKPLAAEIEHVFGEDWYMEALQRDEDPLEVTSSFLEQEGTRLTDYFSEQLIALKAKVPEVATLMCNRAGIYE